MQVPEASSRETLMIRILATTGRYGEDADHYGKARGRGWRRVRLSNTAGLLAPLRTLVVPEHQ